LRGQLDAARDQYRVALEQPTPAATLGEQTNQLQQLARLFPGRAEIKTLLASLSARLAALKDNPPPAAG
jgi:hypothetical protein